MCECGMYHGVLVVATCQRCVCQRTTSRSLFCLPPRDWESNLGHQACVPNAFYPQSHLAGPACISFTGWFSLRKWEEFSWHCVLHYHFNRLHRHWLGLSGDLMHHMSDWYLKLHLQTLQCFQYPSANWFLFYVHFQPLLWSLRPQCSSTSGGESFHRAS